eukprot:91257-Rhodomonas_salina.1
MMEDSELSCVCVLAVLEAQGLAGRTKWVARRLQPVQALRMPVSLLSSQVPHGAAGSDADDGCVAMGDDDGNDYAYEVDYGVVVVMITIHSSSSSSSSFPGLACVFIIWKNHRSPSNSESSGIRNKSDGAFACPA